VCEAQETLNWFSRQIRFGVLKLASALVKHAASLLQSTSFEKGGASS